MSLVWMILALGVSFLTIMVVLQLLDAGIRPSARRLVAFAVGSLMLLEGALVLLRSSNLSEAATSATAVHGVALIVAGAGIWGIAHRSRWRKT